MGEAGSSSYSGRIDRGNFRTRYLRFVGVAKLSIFAMTGIEIQVP